jgi:hypothetical protein
MRTNRYRKNKGKNASQTKDFNNNNVSETSVLKRIEEEKAQVDLDETKQANLRKRHFHYLFLLIIGLVILDAIGLISIKTNLVTIIGLIAKIIGCFPKINSS